MALLATLLQPARQQELRRRIGAAHPEAERRWGTLSLGGALCHLALAYEMAVGDLASSERTGRLQRSVLRVGALYVPLRWPRGVPTLPGLVEGQPGVQPTGHAEDRARLLASFERFVASTGVAGRPHPIFGPLNLWEWMRWGYLHADHHLRQFGL